MIEPTMYKIISFESTSKVLFECQVTNGTCTFTEYIFPEELALRMFIQENLSLLLTRKQLDNLVSLIQSYTQERE